MKYVIATSHFVNDCARKDVVEGNGVENDYLMALPVNNCKHSGPRPLTPFYICIILLVFWKQVLIALIVMKRTEKQASSSKMLTSMVKHIGFHAS